ncbi:MAG: hypothetical protein IPM57_12375 [Oligoflexia bacterium]|nr:hypothetical protein [Oligoflexia bacterium]
MQLLILFLLSTYSLASETNQISFKKADSKKNIKTKHIEEIRLPATAIKHSLDYY